MSWRLGGEPEVYVNLSADSQGEVRIGGEPVICTAVELKARVGEPTVVVVERLALPLKLEGHYRVVERACCPECKHEFLLDNLTTGSTEA